MQINGCSTDLLERFMTQKQEYVAEDPSETELNLGLSLGGCFGVEPSKEKRRLVRSRTVANPTVLRIDDMAVGSVLMRTRSLKESQSMRQLVAKRKREEEQRNYYSRVIKDGAVLEGICKEDKVGEEEEEGEEDSIRHLEGQMGQGMTNCNEVSRHASIRSLTHHSDYKVIVSPLTSMADKSVSGRLARENVNNLLKKPKMENGVREVGMKLMEEMPCVSTRGDGPNGRKIEGFLYRYGKGEEVRIVCLCHGSFLSPAEFVKHAGGGEVEQPLRHIVVNPFTFFL